MTKKMSMKWKNGWLVIHLLFVIVYFTGVLGSIFLAVSTAFTTNTELIHAAHQFIQYFDWLMIIPGTLGSLLTGFWLAARTHWGVTRYYWVIVKWIGNIAVILFGSTWIRIWIHNSLIISASRPFHPLQNPNYLHNRNMLIVGLTIGLATLIFLVVISVCKPWGKRKKYRSQGKDSLAKRKKMDEK